MGKRHSTRALHMRATAILLVGCSLVLWPGCTAERRYKVLSFFFDGVPDPREQAALAGGGKLRGRLPGGEPMIVFSHKPFAEDRCDSCHSGGINALFRPAPDTVTSDVCLRCHRDVPSQYPVMHGPVAIVTPGYPVLGLAARDAAEASVADMAHKLAGQGALAFLTSTRPGAAKPLPFAATGHPITDPLALIVSFYGFVEALSRHRGLNPDVPPALKKVTETV